MKVYADNAATTRVSDTAFNAMLPYFKEQYGNPSSLYTIGQKAQEALYSARETMAKYLNCDIKEITFTSGGSEADNQAILTGAYLGEKKGKKHIISSAFEHHAVLHTLKKLESQGFEITLLPVHSDGFVRVDELEAAIRPDTALVTIMYANNEIGTVQPIAEIGRVCREKGVLFHTDAVQAAGHIKIDVKAENIDMLSLSAHKFHGPKGIGMLYAKKGINLYTLIEGGAQERGKRAGTENVPAIMGMAAAFKEANENIDKNFDYVKSLRDKLAQGLSKIPHSKINGDISKCLAGTLNMCFEGIEGESLLLLLDDRGISASSGSACTSGSLDPSHVLLALGLPHEVAHGSLRISLSEYNTEEEVAHILKNVPEVVAYLRSMSPVWKDLEEGKKQYVIQ
ncbi:MAG TPA: cysteine desulfurase NifS [Ruminococcaceae bacterium]|nr:cysteine desulfurase NifS [Oscillospiraceae bacterium]HBJ10282.1 cysteine desulfurase NifS [Oscillospiraceae bacterium]